MNNISSGIINRINGSLGRDQADYVQSNRLRGGRRNNRPNLGGSPAGNAPDFGSLPPGALGDLSHRLIAFLLNAGGNSLTGGGNNRPNLG